MVYKEIQTETTPAKRRVPPPPLAHSLRMATDPETSRVSLQQPSKTLTDPDVSPNKRLKTLVSDSPRKPRSSSSKGKSKIEDESTADSESPSISCGICLSEDGKSVRGWIDSCDHYFCFVCIMEWAKVESRCPMCKRRFATIRRPPKDGVFFSERIVTVPVRDQVYHYFGNATIGPPPDPYAEVECSVCHSTSDESLLLLCDLCDSAAHTFCVGLGATVPEGDWFCQDCTLLRDEHAKSEMDPNCDGQTGFGNFHKMPLAEAHVSIFDVVRESSITEVERPTTRLHLNRSQLSSHSVPDGGTILAANMTEEGSRTHPTVGHDATKFGARTLRRCRNVQGHIQALRENWNAFRSGSLSFSSSSVDKRNIGQPHSSSCLNQQLTAQRGSSCNILTNRGSHDIDKAWKKMDVAKLIGRNHKRTSIVHQASIDPLRKINSRKEAGNASLKFLAPKSRQLGSKEHGSIGSERQFQEKDNGKYKFQVFGEEKQSEIARKGVPKFVEGFPSTCSPRYHELPSSRKVQSSVQVEISNGNGGNLLRGNFLGALSNAFNGNDSSTCFISPVRSVPAALNISHTKQELHASSSCSPEKKGRMGKGCIDTKARRDDDAKSEIQSLVKLNLKLLSKDKKLEVDVFKVIARLATHSILAACGLEHPKPGVPSFRSLVCCHVDEVKQLRRSTLMPSSCRECFFVYVKDVVNAIMFDKLDGAEMLC